MTGLQYASEQGLNDRDTFVIGKKYKGIQKTKSEWFEELNPKFPVKKEIVKEILVSDNENKKNEKIKNNKTKN